MANFRTIRRRIRSVQNTAKVTRAMQLIAASKMRRAQEQVVAARPYAQKIRQVLSELAGQRSGGDDVQHPLLQQRPVHQSLVVHFTPDRGLCGGLPGNMNRRTAQFILDSAHPVSLLTVGKKGRDFMVRTRQDVIGVFINLSDRPSLADSLPITHLMERLYTDGTVDQVVLAYSQFVNTGLQRPTMTQVLPIETESLGPSLADAGYIYEPDEQQVFAALLPRFLEMQVYHALLESIASEQSARMVAMRNATDNAKSLVGDLTLDMNKLHQDTITRELLDLIGGQVPMEG